MSKRIWGMTSPFIVTGGAIGITFWSAETPAVKWGVVVGLCFALIQSFASIGALSWAWNKKIFYWVWGGGILARFVIFGATAYIVYRFTNLNLAITMISMVTATTLFLVIESMTFFWKK